MNPPNTRPDGLPEPLTKSIAPPSRTLPRELTERERDAALLAYLDALDDGDFEMIVALMERYGADEGFADALCETNLFLAEEIEAAQAQATALAQEADAARVRDLAAAALSAPVAATRAEAEAALRKAEAEEAQADVVPPVTLRDVAAQLRVNVTQGIMGGREAKAARLIAERLETGTEAFEELPDDGPDAARRKITALPIGLDRLTGIALQIAARLFQDAALTLDSQQAPLRLAAARRARQKPSQANRVRETPTPYPAPETNADARQEKETP